MSPSASVIGSASVDTDVTRGVHLLFCEAPALRVHYCLRKFRLSTVVFCCYRVYSIRLSCCLAVRRLIKSNYVVCAVAAEGDNVFESAMVCFT